MSFMEMEMFSFFSSWWTEEASFLRGWEKDFGRWLPFDWKQRYVAWSCQLSDFKRRRLDWCILPLSFIFIFSLCREKENDGHPAFGWISSVAIGSGHPNGSFSRRFRIPGEDEWNLAFPMLRIVHYEQLWAYVGTLTGVTYGKIDLGREKSSN